MAIRTAVNRALTAITALPTAAALANGNLTLLTTATASSSATLDFTSSIDSTYDSYVFKFIDIHPATNGAKLSVNFSIDSGSNYNVTKTTTFFRASHYEDNSDATLGYRTGQDLAQSTGEQELTDQVGNANDESMIGTLQLFNPSSTTFTKHFISTTNSYHALNITQNNYIAGYCNTTSAVDGIRFKFSSGNIDAGVIKMYGVGDKQ
mgnify:CR=1 FL=1